MGLVRVSGLGFLSLGFGFRVFGGEGLGSGVLGFSLAAVGPGIRILAFVGGSSVSGLQDGFFSDLRDRRLGFRVAGAFGDKLL